MVAEHDKFPQAKLTAGTPQERFPGMPISDELLQMIEKVAERPHKVRTITTARVRRFPGSL